VKSSSSTFSNENRAFRQLPLLAAGDLLMLLLFVVIGRMSHGMTSDWLVNLLRIATPFVLGWAIAAIATGAYRPRSWQKPTEFMVRSVGAWLLGVGLAFLLRHFLMQDRITLPFALTSVAFTGLFLLVWRVGFLVWLTEVRLFRKSRTSS